MQPTCKATTKAGTPCRSWAAGPSGYCLMHDPARANERRQAQQAGGSARSSARRAARQWAAIGEQVSTADLPAMLRACMIAVRDGELEPSQASAIANLAKTSVSVANDLELEARIAALEQAAGIAPASPALRRVK